MTHEARTRITCFALVVVPLLPVWIGCSPRQEGPPRFVIRGRVRFDGKPVPAGRIVFEPDTSAGNKGPGGCGNIVNGRYSTYSRMGAVAGHQSVRISGFDGIPAGEFVEGKPLFSEYTTTVELPAKAMTNDFDVPAAAAKMKESSASTAPPRR